jgi:PKD repeat protein
MLVMMAACGRVVDPGSDPTSKDVTARFTYECQGLACRLDASESTTNGAGIQTYVWSLGDGTADSGVVSTHIYPDDGDYTVVLTVTSHDGQHQDIRMGSRGRNRGF